MKLLFGLCTQLFILGSALGAVKEVKKMDKKYLKSLICNYNFFCPLAEPHCTSIRHLICPNGGDNFQPEVVANPGSSTCDTSGCKRLADSILRNMNSTVDPCEDFYEYACGKYPTNEDVPTTEPNWSAIESIKKLVLERLINIADGYDTSRSYSRYILDIYKMYQRCLNTDLVEKSGVQDLVVTLEKLGSWPVMDKLIKLKDRRGRRSEYKLKPWDEAHWKLETTLSLKIREGHLSDSLINLKVNVMPTQTLKWELELDQPETALPRQILLLEDFKEYRRRYVQTMISVAQLVGVDEKKAREEMEQVLQFEIALANISTPKYARDLNLYNAVTVGELEKRFPYVHWTPFINSLVMGKIYRNEVVNLMAPEYYEKLGILLASTPKRVVANYLLWRVIYANIKYFGETIARKDEVIPEDFNVTRKHFCTETMMQHFRPVFGRAYVRKFFPPAAKQQALDLVQQFHKKFKEVIGRLPWMDKKTSDKSKFKAKKFKFFIGYPDELLDNTTLNVYYDDLELNEKKSFAENIAAARKHEAKIKWNRLHKVIEANAWDLHSDVTEVNAYYEPSTNGIAIPAGILQDLYFSPDRPDFYNIATLSYIVGHEMFHSIDNKGKLFDVRGVVRDWWSSKTEAAFKNLSDSISNHYSSYKVYKTNISLLGDHVIGEAIADHGGLKIAYLLSMDMIVNVLNGLMITTDPKNQNKSMIDFPPLPPNQALKKLVGLERFSLAQAWWLSAAQPWCSNAMYDFVQMVVPDDPHLLLDTRVNGPFRNNWHFARDWECRKGSYMNPSQPVNIF